MSPRTILYGAVPSIAVALASPASFAQIEPGADPEEAPLEPIEARPEGSARGERRVEEPREMTAEEHLLLAREHGQRAAGFRKEAMEHRRRAELLRTSPLNAHVALGQSDPRVERMLRRLRALADAADRQAAESQKAADYHELRGKELHGRQGAPP
jgi:hypothetical protein